MNKTYKANWKYPLSILFCVLLFSVPSLFALIAWGKGDKSQLIIMIFLISFIGAFYIFILAREIVITDKFVQIKTLFLKRTIPIEKIKNVAKTYSTKSMIWSGGDKDKAHMLCSVRFGSNPISFFLIHNGISDYKNVCDELGKIKEQKST